MPRTASSSALPAAVDDSTDRAILTALCNDGHTTLSELSALTGLSTSAVQARVQRLEKSGVIRRYRAVIDPQAIGLPLTALVQITPLNPSDPDDAPERLKPLHEIESCYSTAGSSSYTLLVRVATPSLLEDLLQQIRTAANVSTQTTVVLRTYFEGQPISLP